MMKPTSVKEMEQMQGTLQAAYDAALKSSQDAQEELKKAKFELVEFNNKYGRVLQMMREDE